MSTVLGSARCSRAWGRVRIGISSVSLWRRRRRVVAIGRAANIHVVDSLAELAELDIMEFVLKELQVSLAIADLGIETRADSLVCCRGTHSICSID